MKRRFLSSYYSRLVFISALAVILVVFTIVGILIVEMNRERNKSIIDNCNASLTALSGSYEDIWNNYYKVFIPIYDDEETKNNLKIFCSVNNADYSYNQVFNSFERTLKTMCQQDQRISGIYFRRHLDDSKYLYVKNVYPTQRVYFDLSPEVVMQSRSVLGGQKLQLPTTKGSVISFFGIESSPLDRDYKDENKYQVTVLYDLNSFNSVLAEYSLPKDVRFYIITEQGQVVFDSSNTYSSQETSLANFEELTSDGDTCIIDGITYIKGVKKLSRNNSIVVYTFPQRGISTFSISGTGSIILIFGISICVSILLVLLSINRAVNKKFGDLEKGMHRVGKNDLKYRLPVGDHNDEFSRISVQFNKMCDDLEDTINEIYVFKLLQQSMEYKMLQMRVNPHFLFNSLELIREKLNESDENQGSEMVLLLSRIFEYQIRGESIVTIQQELDALQKYIDFSLIRFEHMFEYEIDFDKSILNQMIPKLSLQPILENYFVHGIRGEDNDFVSIRGFLDQDKHKVYICIKDNGKGISPKRAVQINDSLDDSVDDTAHIGLNNVHNRLKIAFGKDSYVRIESNFPEQGSTVWLVFNQELKEHVLDEQF